MSDDTCSRCPWYYRYWKWDKKDAVEWHHLCENGDKSIAVNREREAPPRPDWCKREAQNGTR